MTDKQIKKPDTSSKRDGNQEIRWRTIIFAFAIFVVGVLAGLNLDNDSIKNQFQDTAQSNLPSELNYESVDEVYRTLREKYDGDLTLDEIMNGLKQGLARATDDPYTEYLDEAASETFQNDLDGTFSGIGAELGRDEDAIIIVAPLSGYPAEEVGLRSQDIIVEIDGASARGLSITEAVEKIRGPVGEDVTLTVVRDFERREFTITREDISIPSVEYEVIDGNIGYIKVSRFGEDTVGLVRKALNDFTTLPVDGIVLDMRNNPGGLLTASVELSDLWLPAGSVVLEQRSGNEVDRTFESRNGAIVNDIPTVVLINGGSASASEIVAGALQDNGVATVIGETSFGKGSVQQLNELRSGGTLKVTVARWYTPNGLNIDKEGIKPDKVVERTEEDFLEDRDPQLEAAQEFFRQ